MYVVTGIVATGLAAVISSNPGGWEVPIDSQLTNPSDTLVSSTSDVDSSKYQINALDTLLQKEYCNIGGFCSFKNAGKEPVQGDGLWNLELNKDLCKLKIGVFFEARNRCVHYQKYLEARPQDGVYIQEKNGEEYKLDEGCVSILDACRLYMEKIKSDEIPDIVYFDIQTAKGGKQKKKQIAFKSESYNRLKEELEVSVYLSGIYVQERREELFLRRKRGRIGITDDINEIYFTLIGAEPAKVTLDMVRPVKGALECVVNR